MAGLCGVIATAPKLMPKI